MNQSYPTLKLALEAQWENTIASSERALRLSRWQVKNDNNMFIVSYKGPGRIVSIRSNVRRFLTKVRRRIPHL